MRLWFLLAAGGWLCAGAAPSLLTYDGSGRLLGQYGAVMRGGGYALAPRAAMIGAEAAGIYDGAGRLHPVLWITGEDLDSGVVEVFLGLQAPAGPAAATGIGKIARADGSVAKVRYVKESGGFGAVARLEFEAGAAPPEGPLFDEHGLLLGWHVVKTVDGGSVSFGIPLARLDSIHGNSRKTLGQWNGTRSWVGEQEYLRALGHLWADDFDGARFYFRKAAQLRPGMARVWFHLGFVEGKTGNPKLGIECYRKAVTLEPDYAPGRYYLGFSLVMAGDAEGARAELAALEKLDPALALRLKQFIEIAHVDVLEQGAGAGGMRPRH